MISPVTPTEDATLILLYVLLCTTVCIAELTMFNTGVLHNTIRERYAVSAQTSRIQNILLSAIKGQTFFTLSVCEPEVYVS
ncbi:unknown [Tropheryma whipplei str. Twist]|uniref:Uncharacterized protein n=1 Tax=Tropheryma whipplei (strain Twist) TaxID=203267 RepID=Q83FP8_TROWT|nr:unknown [Tropheryma whipplei str. Twist]